MSKSTEKELSELHGVVARVLKTQLEEKIEIKNDDGTTEVIYNVAPATISAAIKFLKDNDISASIEDDDNLQGLQEQMKAKREKRGLRLVSGEAE